MSDVLQQFQNKTFQRGIFAVKSADEAQRPAAPPRDAGVEELAPDDLRTTSACLAGRGVFRKEAGEKIEES